MGILSLTKGIEEQLDEMVKRANMVPAYLNRVVYRQYQKGQRERWKTENAGDDFAGGKWDSLDPAYETWKHAKYMDNATGHGTKMLIATGRLLFGVVGPSEEHQKVVGSRSIRINTTVPYAVYVDAQRTFSEWSPKFYSRIYKGMADYLTKNIVKEVT